MKQIITILSILLLLTSCSNDEQEETAVTFSVIAQDDQFNGDYKSPKINLLINTEAEWNTLKEKMSHNTVSILKETEIDFTKYQIIAVFDEIRMSSGYSIEVTKVYENENSRFVKIENFNPGGLSSVITQPFQIIKISRSAKTVIFEQ
ncbi:protease complex subunit PrcB family protein [Flavobacterium foetidum]|uniref:protease complex subunit PrcB family protein n=1 Tax=Flavobacterium foetidum TaxID=2026681 RepID=UPI00107515E3|nr:protease complex subunit PrcB family protein [Flavobacterium foetidum]KAF2507459.1 protease complex subunit PrcB family protein [Flavobacterium foetidum]